MVVYHNIAYQITTWWGLPRSASRELNRNSLQLPRPTLGNPTDYGQSVKVGRWFTEIGAWRKTSSNFRFGRLCFISSKFPVFQLWCTECLPAGTAAIRNTPNIICSKYWRDSETVGGTAEAPRNKYWQFQDPPYCIQDHTQNAMHQVPAGFRTRRNRFPPSTGSS